MYSVVRCISVYNELPSLSYLWYSRPRSVRSESYDIEPCHSSKDDSYEDVNAIVEEVGSKFRVHPGNVRPVLP